MFFYGLACLVLERVWLREELADNVPHPLLHQDLTHCLAPRGASG